MTPNNEMMNYALVTGASSGIGYELCLLFARNGYNLILVARKEDKLRHIANDLENNYKIKTLLIPIDLSHKNAAEKIFSQVQEKSITINYLVNNAGFYVKGAFSETSWEEEQGIIQLQCLNHIRLTKLFLPGMLKCGKGGILNVGSTGSFVPGPYNAVYCASKSFVLSFSEALAQEVADSGITVTALCPGGTYTAFQKFDKRKKSILFPVMKASRVAEIGYKSLMKGKRVVIPGRMNKIQVFFIRFIPRNFIVRLTGSIVAKK
ncbi:MAG: hypothetical protein AMS27_04375 [Bacteroides sp. SM23_62_1]|nr:MAG: hypothetical protein AMS27_04375 [Bacteroides sp. SM23_62_1]